MASKRNLKKQVNKVAGILYQDCFVQRKFAPMVKISKMQDEAITRICHPEPGNVKGHFKKLREDFSKQMMEIVPELAILN